MARHICIKENIALKPGCMEMLHITEDLLGLLQVHSLWIGQMMCDQSSQGMAHSELGFRIHWEIRAMTHNVM